MEGIERIVIDLLLQLTSVDELNTFLGNPRHAAIIVGALVSISGALLGVFLLLRRMSLTTDAISHTVLLGIVIAFMVMTGVSSAEPDLSSPWLILGATAAGVLTVVLMETIYRSGLVKSDAALGLAFPLLFAISIILISRYIDNVHLDTDSVMIGSIDLAWANTNSHCIENCDEIKITPDHPLARTGRECINCGEIARDADGNVILDDFGDPLVISERLPGQRGDSPYARFESYCFNCGIYTPAEAVRENLILAADNPILEEWNPAFPVPQRPVLVYFPQAFTAIGLVTIANLLFVLVFYKELKLTTFDTGLATALGFRPGLLNYALMVLVSVTAVSAFDAVGSILVVAFFVIPAATAYLLTNRLWIMMFLSPIFGVAAAFSGYELAQGNLLGIVDMDAVLRFLDRTIGLEGYTHWDSSASASMVMMLFLFFVGVWVASPQQGLVAGMIRRVAQRQRFARQMLLGHIYHHQHQQEAAQELAFDRLHEHLNWSPQKTQRIVRQARALNLVQIEGRQLTLTERGQRQVVNFRQESLMSSRIIE